MIEKPYCAVLSNHISEKFPALRQFILENYSQRVSYKKGEEISSLFNDYVIYLLTGSVKSYLCNENGEERLMYILLDDTIIFNSVNEQFLKTLIVSHPAETFYIEHKKILNFIREDIDFISKYTELITARYGILMQQLLSLNHCSAKHKVYSFIYQLALKYGTVQASTNYVYINNFPSFTDIASITGVHRSNATSYINELKAQDIVGKDKNHFIIKDLQLFEKIITSLDCHEN